SRSGSGFWSGSGGGAGCGRDGVVPFAVERGAADDPFAQVPHPVVADLDPGGVDGVVADGAAFEAVAGDGGGDPGDGVVGAHQGTGLPGAGDVAEQPVLDPVPLAGAGREVADRYPQPRLRREDGELVLPRVVPAVVAAAGVAGHQDPGRARVAGLPLGQPPAAD